MRRFSLLCFIGVDGLFETFQTNGTYDQKTFVTCFEIVITITGIYRQIHKF